ncbi:hypothetical protein L7E55_12425 [Pelotomaculum isophthalicicum JI]|uniref:Glycosyl hydrolase family 32 N-terminal domain-containing protein n=1 Tax=Pelotomaculum isophthalicicum JI TaxID=947010 RepID=A0A9X4H3K0_9FIRM|nr:hypothetical protein [Pelotomaculum isophthalicicum]MDF9409151.1 hypothetical protein [Pelotomaculum isophthalicicum JI]
MSNQGSENIKLYTHNIHSKTIVNIGSRLEMFLDDYLIENSSRGVNIRLHSPIKREIVLETNKPWEGPASAYYTVFKDGSIIRLYYRGFAISDTSENQVTCYAESTDGIHFNRPNIGLYEFKGSKNNNIIFMGYESHNFAPFLDINPNTKENERYKAIGARWPKINGQFECQLHAFKSPDGINWTRIRENPIRTKGAFDSLNVAFYDSSEQCYRLYSRNFDVEGYRIIQWSTSKDFINWSDPQPNRYPPGYPIEHLYTNATIPCPGAEHIYLSFPKRFVPERKKVIECSENGVSDAVFMSSRDGALWNRFAEGWIRPDLDKKDWTHRSNMPAWGIIQVDPNEFSFYISENYCWPTNRLRRMTIRRHGFSSMHADYNGGEFTTRPLTFNGKHLILNYSTSAVGFVKVEIQDQKGKPLPGYTLDDMLPLYGNELDSPVEWQTGSNIASLNGQIVRFRFFLKDADIYALRTGELKIQR